MSSFLSASNIFLIVILLDPFSSSLYYYILNSDWSFKGHISCALPTKMIFNLLRSIRSKRLISHYSSELMLDMLELIIIKWLQVSFTECNRQTLRLKFDLCLGTWFRATERLVRSLPG